ncbi:hypothetical protein M3Y98_00295400 [Aphelenchoides besseyi]|nr:hypothetical protein M3Y98_00295400 [Aphelenchoides besseyi]KAI6201170.1 hypothetical protein M3Y96_00813400 [Aphelenchoides besseyi]
MALTLPLHFFDTLCRCCGSVANEGTSQSATEIDRLAQAIVANASLFDMIKWQRVSKAFRLAAQDRFKNYTRVDIRVYNGLHKLHNHHCEKGRQQNGPVNSVDLDAFEWHPNAQVLLAEMGSNGLGIAVDTNMNQNDVRALIEILTVFRLFIEQIFIDGPVMNSLVSQLNRQQMYTLLMTLRNERKTQTANSVCTSSSRSLAAFNPQPTTPLGPFFVNLKKLTVTSTSNELEYLSRLSTYAIGADCLFEMANIDLLCLKIVLGGRFCQKRHVRLFRHVTRFRQWAEADSLGERYLQQFSRPTNSRLSYS